MFASYALRSLTDRGVRSAVFLVSGMDLISIVVVLIVAGVLLWLVQTYIPMPAPIKTVLTVVIILFLCLWLLRLFGVGHIYVGSH